MGGYNSSPFLFFPNTLDWFSLRNNCIVVSNAPSVRCEHSSFCGWGSGVKTRQQKECEQFSVWNNWRHQLVRRTGWGQLYTTSYSRFFVENELCYFWGSNHQQPKLSKGQLQGTLLTGVQTGCAGFSRLRNQFQPLLFLPSFPFSTYSRFELVLNNESLDLASS